jgi:molybdate transport system substrate-binding protein
MGQIRAVGVAVSTMLVTSLCACSSPAEPDTIVVFAAASLQKSSTEIGERFRADHPGDLVTQLTQGATADVFASADTRNMDKADEAGLLAADPVSFASNALIIAVAPGNPHDIGSFADLSRPGSAVVVCAPAVPCGSATQRVEDATGTALDPVSEDSSVTDVLNKVTSGQADAGWPMSRMRSAQATR